MLTFRSFLVFSGNIADHIHRYTEIYRESVPFPEDAHRVQGYDFNQGVDHRALLQSYLKTGFQATNFGLAVQQINSMVTFVVHHQQAFDIIFI